VLRTEPASSDILQPSQQAVDVKPAPSSSLLSAGSRDEVMTAAVPHIDVTAATPASELSTAASTDDTDRASSPHSLSGADLTGYSSFKIT